MPKTEGFYEDGTYYLRVTYFYENPDDKDEFDGLTWEGMMCDPEELDMAIAYHGDEYVQVKARLARQVPLPQIDSDRHNSPQQRCQGDACAKQLAEGRS